MFLELSYLFGIDEPKWPTNPNDSFVLDSSMPRGELCNASTIHHHMHNGTHVDAPRHFTRNGLTIDQLPIDQFCFDAPLVLKIPKGKGERLLTEDFSPYAEKIAACDILLIYTGYADLRASNPKAFIDDFPCFSAEGAAYLRRSFPRLKAIALDVLSVDSAVTGAADGFAAHHALLDRDETHTERTLLIFEDVNTKLLFESKTAARRIYAFPVRFKGLEAAPIAMVAEL